MHLKNLLSEIGMTGKFSLAKAQKIKDERELQAEVAAIQKDAEWGMDNDDDDDEKITTRAGKSSTTSSSGRKLVRFVHSAIANEN